MIRKSEVNHQVFMISISMSNPLIHPDDPRFQRRNVLDAAEKNPFADEVGPTRDRAPAGDVYTTSVDGDAQPFAAQYPVQQISRARLLMFLGGVGWGAAAVGALSFTGWFDAGWLCPLIGIAPSAAAWLLAHEELKAVRLGAINSEAQPQAKQAFWLGATGVLACVGVLAAMIAWEMRLLPTR